MGGLFEEAALAQRLKMCKGIEVSMVLVFVEEDGSVPVPREQLFKMPRSDGRFPRA